MAVVPAERFRRDGPESRETLLFAALVAVSGAIPLSLPAFGLPGHLLLPGLLLPVLAVVAGAGLLRRWDLALGAAALVAVPVVLAGNPGPVGGVLLVSYCLLHTAIPLARRGAAVGECWVFIGLPAFVGLTAYSLVYAPGTGAGRAVGGSLTAAGALALVFGTAGWAIGRRTRRRG